MPAQLAVIYKSTGTSPRPVLSVPMDVLFAVLIRTENRIVYFVMMVSSFPKGILVKNVRKIVQVASGQKSVSAVRSNPGIFMTFKAVKLKNARIKDAQAVLLMVTVTHVKKAFTCEIHQIMGLKPASLAMSRIA